MTGLDPSALREDFPALDRTVSGEQVAYLDNAATTQKPEQVIDAVEEFYTERNANAHRGIHTMGYEATELYEDAHRDVASFIGAADWREIVLTSGTTAAINLVAAGWARHNLDGDDSIVLTPMEHHSNLVPWQQVAEETGADLRFLELDGNRIDPASIDATITDDTGLVAVSHVSNVLGTVNPIQQICQRAAEVGAVSVVDAAQAAPHLPLDVQEIGCDFLAFSGHKLCGPMGTGALYGRQDRLDELEPAVFGGDMVDTVSREGATWERLPWRLEPGTPNIAGAAGLSAAIEYLTDVGRDSIGAHSRRLASTLAERLAAVDGVTVYAADRSPGIVSFTVDGVHPHDVGQLMDDRGIEVRSGDHCCQPLMATIGPDATVRASCYLYNTVDEIERLVDAIDDVKETFS